MRNYSNLKFVCNIYCSYKERTSILLHELVHSTGHIDRLNREGVTKANRNDTINYSKEELIAEMGASFLCVFTGIENPDLTNNSAAYLQSWLQVFKQDKTMVVKAASMAQKAVDFMVGFP